MNILQLIATDSFITVNKALIKVVGLEAAVLIGELASEHTYWSQHNGFTDEGYFFSTIENIEEKTSLSEHKQRQALKKLEELGIVTVKIKGLPAKRYIKINQEQLLKLFENKVLNTFETSSGKFQELEPENFKRNNNINNNNITIINNMSETSSPTNNSETTSLNNSFEDKNIVIDAPTPPPVEKPKRKTRKDQLVEFVNSLNYSDETKQELLKWIFQIGLKGNLTVEQLKDKLAQIHNIYSNEALIRESIKNSYHNNWFGFFPVNKPTPQYKTPATPEKSPSTPITQKRLALSNEVF